MGWLAARDIVAGNLNVGSLVAWLGLGVYQFRGHGLRESDGDS